jgi:hypothetical protein
MSNKFKKIDVEIDLFNSKLISCQYCFNEEKCINIFNVLLETSNTKKIEFVFYNFKGVIESGNGILITEFYININPTEFLKKRWRQFITKYRKSFLINCMCF